MAETHFTLIKDAPATGLDVINNGVDVPLFGGEKLDVDGWVRTNLERLREQANQATATAARQGS